MIATILFAAWILVGTIAMVLARIKTPHDTEYGKANPDEAWLAFTLMMCAWPLTVWNRKKFARYGNPRDDNNPSWLAEERD